MKKLHLTLIALALSLPLSAQITSYPYTEDFESFSLCGTGCGATCSLSGSWINETVADDLDWLTDAGGTSSSNTGPSVDHTTGSITGKYLYVESSCSGTGYPNKTASLLSPVFNFSSLASPELSFWYHMYGITMGTMHVDISTNGGTSYTNDIVPSWTDDQDLWQEMSIDLTAWAGQTAVVIRIRHVTGTGFSSDAAVDDFMVVELLPDDAGVTEICTPSVPTCVFNDTVRATVTNFGTDTLFSADVAWTLNGTAQATLSWTGSLAQGESDACLLIGTAPYASGDDLVLWTENPNGVVEAPGGAGNDTSSLALQTGLSGSYTLGGGAADYPDFLSAVDDLNTFGVCGSVTFLVNNGTYNEQLLLTEVAGSSSTDRIIFSSQSGNKDSVNLTFFPILSAENYTLLFDGADNIEFQNMTISTLGTTFGRVLEFKGGANYNRIADCHVRGDTAISTTSTNMTVIYSGTEIDNYNVFENNVIEGGSYGVYWYGMGTTDLEVGTQFINNHFLNNYYFGSRLFYQDASTFTGNIYETNSSYTGSSYAFYFLYNDGQTTITNNRVMGSGIHPRYGIYVNNSDGAPGQEILVANNMVTFGDTTTGASTTYYGIYCSSNGRMNIYNNSVLLLGGGTSSRAIYVAGGGLIKVVNNSFEVMTDAYGLFYSSTFAVVESDHNNVYAPMGNVGFFGGIDLVTMADWQGTTLLDSSSLSTNPVYQSWSDLHSCSDTLDGTGTPLAEVSTDIDGDLRNTEYPDIGADEFVSPTNFASGSDSSYVCADDSITLYADVPGADILWSTGDTVAWTTVSGPDPYFATITNACGMATRDYIVIGYPNVVVDLGADTIICEGSAITLDAGNTGATYAWSSGESSQSIEVTTAGGYGVMVTSADGCEGEDSVTVGVSLNPAVDLGADTTVYDSLILDAGNNDASYLWTTGETSQTITVTQTNNYGVTVTDLLGCSSSDMLLVIVLQGPNSISGDLELAELSYYPNPTSGSVTVSFEGEVGNYLFEIREMTGRLLYSKEVAAYGGLLQEELDFATLSEGMYLIRIINEGKSKVLKIIKR